ncbi:MAG: arginine--tRNA ligase [Pseudomonadota bacterium]
MNIFAEIKRDMIQAISDLRDDLGLPGDVSFDGITVEPPRDPLHGDMATNAAMVLAKPAGMKPRDLADKIKMRLADIERIDTVDIAGPGFINLRLAPSVWQNLVPIVAAQGGMYGRSEVGHGKRVNVEYVSANPTGPLHVGHTRGAVFGDALASLLAFAGYEVTREYYINDGGSQVDTLARSVYLRYLEACGQTVAFEDGTYPGDYLIPVGHAVKEKFGDSLVGEPEEIWLSDLREFSTEKMMELIRDDLALLGVEMNVFFSEKSLYGTGRIEAAIDDLKSRDLVYWGVLPPPKGRPSDDWEEREQWLFRSTTYGDDEDRPVQKSDGAWAYFAPDIAYHYDKVQRGYDLLIDIFGADHGGYVKRMKAAVAALSQERVPLDIKLTQLVKLFKDGAEFKMSKRAGTFITLRDLIEEVGPDVTRFHMLTRKNDAPLDFDFDKVLEQSKDNPVFYVQYAHARICSAFRKAGVSEDDVKSADLAEQVERLSDASEMAVIKKIAEWPRLVELAALHNEPHRIAFYAYDLASVFHSLWNRGKDDASLRLVQDSAAETTPKLALALATASVLRSALGILGVQPLAEMR